MIKKRESLEWIKWVVALALIILIGIISWLLSKTEESYISKKPSNDSKIDSLTCEIQNSDEAFFQSNSANNSKHEIRATFKDDNLDKIAYYYNASYSSESIASSAEASFHADYNIYMGNNNIPPTSLAPTFSTIDNELKISLYSRKDNLNAATLQFFFLNTDEFQKIKNHATDSLKKIYKNKGFFCTTN